MSGYNSKMNVLCLLLLNTLYQQPAHCFDFEILFVPSLFSPLIQFFSRIYFADETDTSRGTTSIES